MTLDKAKSIVMDNLSEGVDCPCCGQFAKLYKRKLNSGMARALIRAYRQCQYDGSPYGWFHLMTITNHRWRDASVLTSWGFLEARSDDKPEDGKTKTSGYYRLTSEGVKFALGKIDAPKRVFLFNDKVRGFSEERTSIEEALGDDFNYTELMDR